MIVHRDASLIYTADQDYCGQSDLTACEGAVVSAPADPESTVVFHVLAAFPAGSSPRLKGMAFGIEYDPERLTLVAHGPCLGDLDNGAMEHPGAGWPESGSGTSLVFEATQTGGLVESYWFAAYANAPDSVSFRVTAHPDPALAGMFADDSVPSLLDPIVGYGRLGFGMAGYGPCSGEADPDQPEGVGSEDPSEGGGDFPEDEEDSWQGGMEGGCVGIEDPTSNVSVYLTPGAVEFDPYMAAPVAVGSVRFLVPGLRDNLQQVGALTMRKEYPGTVLADTLGYDENGQAIRLPDISGYYELAFADTAAACSAVTALLQMEGIRSAQIVPDYKFRVQATPDDDYYDQWRFLQHDAQWHLHNDGDRGPTGRCGQAMAGYDIGAEQAWSAGVMDSSVVIGDVDSGIMGGMAEFPDSTHEDLRVIPLTYAQRQLINKHPDQNLCYPHGTAMSGLAAAKTNNARGVAGVCGSCSMLDIEWSPCNAQDCDSQEDSCGAVDHGWEDALRNATQLPLPDGKRLKVALLEFARGGAQVALNNNILALLWRLRWQHGLSMVAPSTDTFKKYGNHTVIPANVPFVFGVGAHTWEGLAWDSLTSCFDTPNQGNGLGYSEWPVRDRAGSVLEMCAPGSGHTVTTQPYDPGCSPVDSCRYYWTKGMCSGAAAITAGAVGFLQSLHHQGSGGYLDVDDVEGILRSTTRPFRIDPTDPQLLPTCPPSICPREFYGSGMLDLAAAAELVDSLLTCRIVLQRLMVTSTQPGWTYVPVDSGLVYDGPVRKMWIQYKGTGQGAIPRRTDELGLTGLPRYVGWVKPLLSLSFPAYGIQMYSRKDLALSGIHDCRMGPIDQETGVFTATGYDFAWKYDHPDSSHDLHYLIGEDNMRFMYGFPWPGQGAAVPERAPGRDPVLSLRSLPSPVSGPVSVGFTVFPEAEVDISAFDVSGRQVGRIFHGRVASGYHETGWDLRDGAGFSLPRGIYWICLQAGLAKVTRRMVVVH